MKEVGLFTIILVSLIFPVGINSSTRGYSFTSPFDEYGPICWEDEEARLDNFAARLHESSTAIGHIIVYDAKYACRGEALARALRAKKYLVQHRKVDPNRVVIRWGGYLNELTTTLHDVPRGAAIWPFTPSISAAEVKFVGKCKGKVRPVKCLR
jgi:hypothetical protein